MKRLTVIVICLIVFLTGCGCSKKEDVEGQLSKETAKEETKVSAEILADILNDTIAEAEENNDGVPDYIKEMDKSYKVEVLSFEQKTKDYVEAKVQVTAPDLYGVIKKLDEEEFSSEAEIDEALTEGIKSAERITKDLNVNFYYKDEWTPSLTEEFMDACYGGIITLRREYYEDMKGVS